MQITPWILPDFDPVEKKLTITGGILSLDVDFDDVDHQEVEAYVRAIVKTLNSHRDEILRKIPQRFQ